jgi:hypothetical protein
MSADRPKRDSMSIEEATVSNMWEIAARIPPARPRLGQVEWTEAVVSGAHNQMLMEVGQ